jgi:hypothetical protein
MRLEQQLSSFAIDLTRLHRRTVTAFYSNLVTRPTGRAVRLGIETQLVEMGGSGTTCVSILDFSQVQVMDYSCADEVIAKLLLRYAQADRPVDAYFVARGLQEHHREAVEAVLERHRLLLLAHDPERAPTLLGPCTPHERACWSALVDRERARASELVPPLGIPLAAVQNAVERLLSCRVVVRVAGEMICPLPVLARS